MYKTKAIGKNNLRYSLTYLVIFQLLKASCFFRISDNDSIGDAVIIMSHGLSGSTWFCDVVRNTYPYQGDDIVTLNKELFGTTVRAMKELEDPVGTMQRHLSKQRSLCPRCLLGFKWKPDWDGPKYDPARAWVAKLDIPVLYMYRNPLDLLISKKKHNLSQTLEYHCAATEVACINKHKAVKVYFEKETLIPLLRKYTIEINYIQMQLHRAEVRYFPISYESIAFGSMSERLSLLQNIVDFLYPGNHSITASAKHFETRFFPTNARNHSLQISNYVEVVKALRGTQFSRFLH
jgi:hypothetical protein